jgi:YtxH-like protein
MVDGFTDASRLQARRAHIPGGWTMATDTSGFDEGNEQAEGPEGRGLGGFAVGVIFGAFLGAGIALLFAPERGEKTRRRLRHRLRSLRDEAGDQLERAGKRTGRDLLRRRRRLEAGLGRAASKARDAL